ncbi:MAG: hypothetical protein HY007_03245 [Candidatus Sungbacteria bacterium]|nr:hypothetical protein [Candidatus Sungbacteria bacterium]
MITVTIPKTTYERLKRHAEAYRRFATNVFEAVVRDPIGEITDDFRKTALYTEEFLHDLDAGLCKSSLMKRHAHRTTQARSQRASRRS